MGHIDTFFYTCVLSKYGPFPQGCFTLLKMWNKNRVVGVVSTTLSILPKIIPYLFIGSSHFSINHFARRSLLHAHGRFGRLLLLMVLLFRPRYFLCRSLEHFKTVSERIRHFSASRHSNVSWVCFLCTEPHLRMWHTGNAYHAHFVQADRANQIYMAICSCR